MVGRLVVVQVVAGSNPAVQPNFNFRSEGLGFESPTPRNQNTTGRQREWWNRNYRSAYWEDGAIDRFKEARRIG